MDAPFESLAGILGSGTGSPELNAVEMASRAALVYLATLTMVRIGERRFMGRSAAFDVILGIVLGSVVSRAITGNAPFLPTLVAGATLVLLHWVFAAVAFRSHTFGVLIKGRELGLLQDGNLLQHNLRKCHVTERDLLESLRTDGNLDDPREVAKACLERSGKISVVRRKHEPRVVDVQVRAGVQTVRIEVS